MTGFSKKAAQASAGMAYLAGTGPAGKACRDCDHFHLFAKVGECKEYRRTSTDKKTTISGDNAACRKFVEKPVAPVAPITPAPPPRPSLPQKTCAMPNCKRHVDSWARFCAYHWFGLPDTHQQRVTAARKEEAPALADAVAAAVYWSQTEGERP